jgi:CBS domain-containing protein
VKTTPKRLIKEIMTNQVITIDADMTADEALILLHELKINAAPVIDTAGKVFGVLSCKDITKLHLARENMNANHAWEICTPMVITVSPASPVRDAVDQMIKNSVHHIIVTEGDKLKGIVSSLDILNSLDESF